MFYDVDHPNVTLSEWEAFKVSDAAHRIVAEVVDRRDCGFPDCFVPLARGAAIASPALLSEAGYREETSPRIRNTRDRHSYSLALKRTKGAKLSNHLIVRQCEGHECWVIERRMADVYQVLVCKFGSTPILAPNVKSAMCLAKYCNVDNPPHDLRWVQQEPDGCEDAIVLAGRRLCAEIFGANQLYPEALLRGSTTAAAPTDWEVT